MDFLGVCLESTFWCLIYSVLLLFFFLLYLWCSFYIFCLVILSFNLKLTAFFFWLPSVERKAWKSVSPSRPLKLIISRTTVSCHSIFKFESLKSSVHCFISTSYSLSMPGFIFWEHTTSAVEQYPTLPSPPKGGWSERSCYLHYKPNQTTNQISL